MIRENLFIHRHSEEGLRVKTWGFKVWMEQTHDNMKSVGINIELLSYEDGVRQSKRHKKIEPTDRRRYGSHYPKHDGKREYAWFDLTQREYAWSTGDVRHHYKDICEPPTIPTDVADEVCKRVRLNIFVPEREYV